MKHKISSWNVNGIRACIKKGFFNWMDSDSSDIVCIQETKASPDQLEEGDAYPENYHTYYASAQKKGYSGVAIYSKKCLPEPIITIGLGIEEFDNEGRTIIARYPSFNLINCYFPNGQRDHGRVPYKLRYCQAISEQVQLLKIDTGNPVIVCGDYNTAHHPIDLRNPKSNKKSTGFLENERAWLDQFQEEGMIDTFRHLHPEEPDHYTWWTYRSGCREKNVGWRIDYFFATDDLKDQILSSNHSPKVLGSDHCPLGIEVEFS